jgi:hypothetical protein
MDIDFALILKSKLSKLARNKIRAKRTLRVGEKFTVGAIEIVPNESYAVNMDSYENGDCTLYVHGDMYTFDGKKCCINFSGTVVICGHTTMTITCDVLYTHIAGLNLASINAIAVVFHSSAAVGNGVYKISEHTLCLYCRDDWAEIKLYKGRNVIMTNMKCTYGVICNCGEPCDCSMFCDCDEPCNCNVVYTKLYIHAGLIEISMGRLLDVINIDDVIFDFMRRYDVATKWIPREESFEYNNLWRCGCNMPDCSACNSTTKVIQFKFRDAGLLDFTKMPIEMLYVLAEIACEFYGRFLLVNGLTSDGTTSCIITRRTTYEGLQQVKYHEGVSDYFNTNTDGLIISDAALITKFMDCARDNDRGNILGVFVKGHYECKIDASNFGSIMAINFHTHCHCGLEDYAGNRIFARLLSYNIILLDTYSPYFTYYKYFLGYFNGKQKMAGYGYLQIQTKSNICYCNSDVMLAVISICKKIYNLSQPLIKNAYN